MKNRTQDQSKNIGLRFKIIIAWLGILLLASFWLTVKGSSEPVSMAVIPQVPRQGEPVIVTFNLNNPASQAVLTNYQFYANGKLLKEGTTTLVPGFAQNYKYVFNDPVPLGERLNFVVRTQSNSGDYEKMLSTPPYPPQIWSSFISFASFSTTVMSFMSTMSYYQGTFGKGLEMNLGMLFSVILAVLLIFIELSQPVLKQKNILVLGNLKLRFNTVTWILLIIVMGLVYTRMAVLISGL